MQVQRALKNAMNAGLLRYRSGRYKVLATLNPTPPPAPPAKESTNNDQKNEEKKLKPNVRAPVVDVVPSHRRQEHKYIAIFLRNWGATIENNKIKQI